MSYYPGGYVLPRKIPFPAPLPPSFKNNILFGHANRDTATPRHTPSLPPTPSDSLRGGADYFRLLQSACPSIYAEKQLYNGGSNEW